MLVMTGPTIAVGLRSMPVRYLFPRRSDGYPLDVDGEGNAVALAEARTRTFARRKIFIVSTPTIAGVSTIERIRNLRPAPLLRAVPALRSPAMVALRATALGAWRNAAQPDTAAYVCRILRGADPGASQDLDAGARRMASDGRGKQQDGGLSPVVAVQPDRLAQWRISPGPGEFHQQGVRICRPRSRPSRTPNSGRPGSRKVKRLTGSGCWNAARTIASAVPADRWPVAGDGRCRRAEGSRRSLGLGLRRGKGPGSSSTGC